MKILKLILGMLMGAAVGFGVVMLIVWLVESGKEPSPEKVEEAMDWGKIALSIGLSFVFLFLSIIVHTALHEAGHLIAGLVTGYTFLSYRLFRWMIVREGGKTYFKKFNITGTMGQCIMIPPTYSEDVPYFWFNAGGVIVNIMISAISIIVLRNFDLGMVGMSAWIMLAFVGIFMAAMNGFPYAFNGVSNDGRNILQLYGSPERRKSFAISLLGAAEQSRGTRLRDMPSEWFKNEPVKDPADNFAVSDRLMYMSLQEDLGNYEGARLIAEEIESFGDSIPQLFRMELGGEHVMLELLTTKRPEVIKTLWTKQLEAYTKNASRFSASKLVFLYAYELLFKNDEEAAQSYRSQLMQKKDSFANPGETKTALELCNVIYNKK